MAYFVYGKLLKSQVPNFQTADYFTRSYPSRKTSVLVPIGKPRALWVRGFSLIQAPDTEANTYGRAFLFAEHHVTELDG